MARDDDYREAKRSFNAGVRACLSALRAHAAAPRPSEATYARRPWKEHIHNFLADHLDVRMNDAAIADLAGDIEHWSRLRAACEHCGSTTGSRDCPVCITCALDEDRKRLAAHRTERLEELAEAVLDAWPTIYAARSAAMYGARVDRIARAVDALSAADGSGKESNKSTV